VSLDTRQAALLEEVARYRDTAAVAALAAAREEVAGYLAHARGEARRRFHAAAQETRRQAAARIGAAEAAQAAVARQRRHEVGRAVVAAGLPMLEAAVVARWHDPVGRRQWLAWAARSAAARLVGGGWEVAHPPAWAVAEWELAIAAGGDPTPRLVADPAIAAGVRITAGGAFVDATVAGLLADRERIGGRLLALTLPEGGEG